MCAAQDDQTYDQETTWQSTHRENLSFGAKLRVGGTEAFCFSYDLQDIRN